MKLNWNLKPYLFTSNQSDAEVDALLENFNDEISDQKAVQIILVTGDMESEIQFTVTCNKTIVFLTEQKLKTYSDLLSEIGIVFTFTDASDSLFFGEWSIEGASDDFKSLSKQWIEKVYTVNDVLDKINLKGIHSLTDSDKQILSTQK